MSTELNRYHCHYLTHTHIDSYNNPCHWHQLNYGYMCLWTACVMLRSPHSQPGSPNRTCVGSAQTSTQVQCQSAGSRGPVTTSVGRLAAREDTAATQPPSAPYHHMYPGPGGVPHLTDIKPTVCLHCQLVVSLIRYCLQYSHMTLCVLVLSKKCINFDQLSTVKITCKKKLLINYIPW